MYPQKKFRSHEDEDEQVLYRPDLVATPSHFRIPVAQLIIFGFACAYSVLSLNDFLVGWFDSYSGAPEALKENFFFNPTFLAEVSIGDPVSVAIHQGVASGHAFLGSILSPVLGSAALITHALSLIQLLALVLPLIIVLFSRAGLVPVSFSLAWLIYEESAIRVAVIGIESSWAPPILATYLAANLFGSLRFSTVIVLSSVFLCPAISPVLIFTQAFRFFGFMISSDSKWACGDTKLELASISYAILAYWGLSKLTAMPFYSLSEFLFLPLSIMIAVFLPLVIWEFVKLQKGSSILGVNVKGTFILLTVVGVLLSLAPKSQGIEPSPPFISSDPEVWRFVSSELPSDSILGGYPGALNDVQFFGNRQALITEGPQRLSFALPGQIITVRRKSLLRAHFAVDSKSFLSEVESLGVSHFIFDCRVFIPASLRTFTTKPLKQLLYARIPEKVDAERYPFMKFRSDKYVIISVLELRDFLQSGGRLPWPKV